jgi:hypothetical protein
MTIKSSLTAPTLIDIGMAVSAVTGSSAHARQFPVVRFCTEHSIPALIDGIKICHP